MSCHFENYCYWQFLLHIFKYNFYNGAKTKYKTEAMYKSQKIEISRLEAVVPDDEECFHYHLLINISIALALLTILLIWVSNVNDDLTVTTKSKVISLHD